MNQYSRIESLSNIFAVFWFAWFMASIALIGGIAGLGVALPLYVFGQWFPSFPAIIDLADTILCAGIGFLMGAQPWLRGKISLNRPYCVKPGALLVSNHRSHLDAFLILSRFKGVRILSKSVVFRVPFLGLMMWASRQIPVRRGDVSSFARAMEKIEGVLRGGGVAHVFPEMTRCEYGYRGVGEFALTPFKIAKDCGVPVIPIVFDGTEAIWPRSRPQIFFRRPVSARTLGILDPDDFASSGELMRTARRMIRDALLSVDSDFEVTPAHSTSVAYPGRSSETYPGRRTEVFRDGRPEVLGDRRLEVFHERRPEI